jgi:hypothetical protein
MAKSFCNQLTELASGKFVVAREIRSILSRRTTQGGVVVASPTQTSTKFASTSRKFSMTTQPKENPFCVKGPSLFGKKMDQEKRRGLKQSVNLSKRENRNHFLFKDKDKAHV